MKSKQKVGQHLIEELLKNEEYQKIVETIDKEVDFIGVRPYSHNIIGFALAGAAKKFGKEVANDLIDEFNLEDHGWVKE